MGARAIPDARRKLTHYRDLLIELVVRDMKLRYKRSVLGIVWSLLNPLAQLLVFLFVFRYVLPLNVPNYPLFLFTGILAWTWFQQSLQYAAGAIVDNAPLIRQPGFPPGILPVATVVAQMINYVLALPVLAAFVLWIQGPLTSAVVAIPLVMAVQFLVTLSLAYLVATSHVRFRDTQYLLGVALMLGFYLTPVFYRSEAMPSNYATIYRLNPLVHVIEAYRTIVLDGRIPQLLPLGTVAAAALVVLGVSYALFRHASHHFIEEL